MKSLAVRNGDLSIGPRGFEEVHGQAKVIQDLGLALREPHGSDRFHPNWGSVLDDHIGYAFDENAEVIVQAEIYRVVRNYMALQQHRLQQDQARGRASIFSADEILVSIDGVILNQTDDKLDIKVSLGMLSGRVVEATLETR